MNKIDSYIVRTVGIALLAIPFGSAFAEDPVPENAGDGNVENIFSNDSTSIDYDMLDEFEITALAKVVTSDGTKLTYNADEDPAATGKTVLEMLRGVPMITIDGDDNIRVNGKEGVRFLINGKEDPMLSANAKQILKAMPSAAVSKVEVIHEPGAKYDAEGNAGIINLITERKQKNDGYNGTLSATLGSTNSNISAFGMFKYKNFSMSGNINYSNTLLQSQKGWANSENYYVESGQTLYSDSKQYVEFGYLGGGLSMSYEPTEKDLITVSANVYDVDARIKDSFSKDYMTSLTGNLLWETNKKLYGSIMNLGLTANAGYQHTFNNPFNTLVVSYQYNFGRNPIDLTHEIIDATNSPRDFSRMNQLNKTYNREHTGQIDYTLPFAENKQQIGIGAKAILRNNNAISGTELLNENGSQIGKEKENAGQFQEIYAGYATYLATIADKVSLNGGLRYEHTRMGIHFTDRPQDNFTNHLNDIVPNAGVTYIFGPSTNIRLAYQMRISRPNLNQVNPYMMETVGLEYQSGNPNLKSEHSNLLNLTYTNFGRLIGGNVGLELFDSRNMIQSYTYTDGIYKINSFANIGRKQSVALTGFVNYQITPIMSVNLNARVEYGALKAPSLGYRHNGWNTTIHAGWSWNPEKIARFSVNGGFMTRYLTLQGWNSGWYYYSVSASRSFLADKSLTVTLSAQNFLQRSVKYVNTNSTRDVISRFTYNMRNWGCGVTVSWAFGNYQGQVKKLSKISNDDTSTVSGNSKGAI